MLPRAVLAKPVKGTAHCTLYYVFEAPGEESAKGSKVTVITTKGEKLRVRVSPPILRKANLEGTVTSVDPKDGTRYVTNIVRLGVWKDLPEGWEGMGNRSNPLTYYRTVAADQRRHPYGSRIFAPSLVGESIHGWDHPHDGYLWVADSGGAIKGYMRFDVFVGREEVYEWVMELENQKGHWNVPVEVEKLPSAPSGYNPGTDSGLKKILSGLGLLKGDSEAEVTAALTDFQKQHQHIPKPEYGSPRGAITLWYLTQAALKVAKGEHYDPVAASTHPKPQSDKPKSESDKPKLESKKSKSGSDKTESEGNQPNPGSNKPKETKIGLALADQRFCSRLKNHRRNFPQDYGRFPAS